MIALDTDGIDVIRLSRILHSQNQVNPRHYLIPYGGVTENLSSGSSYDWSNLTCVIHLMCQFGVAVYNIVNQHSLF
ncbi:hypothetical protein M501DRAFT_523107 [Patellaria atrata CBS 101060]|uniref:Uncharacterized protein n=1 Tax=Patellaria atrata CBS 101060 TaxID=1346257 RepID=A0A9P4S1C3_9PEZI|nr:hypothetical protein M501DRAFT_523107 [Patellaria atrata CBS 101060]